MRGGGDGPPTTNEGWPLKRTRVEFETVLVDGGVRLPPGAFFSCRNDAPLSPNPLEIQAWMGWLRGRILSHVFGLENDLIRIELAANYGHGGGQDAPSGYFDADQALREEHSLNKKIDRVKPIIRKHREQDAGDRLIQGLAECREVRNLMAHYSCWMEPINDDERKLTVGLKLFIGDRHHIWELSEDDARHWDELFLEVRRELIRLRLELIGAPPPVFAKRSLATVAPSTGSEETERQIMIGGVPQAL